MRSFKGLVAKQDDKLFVQKLKEKNALVHAAKVTHDYAHCERCKTPVVFRATEQWFFKVEDLLKKFFPADFILEASEQVRLWFYMLLLGSILAFDRHCYENVYMTGMLYGVDGVKMSKSLGNIIS